MMWMSLASFLLWTAIQQSEAVIAAPNLEIGMMGYDPLMTDVMGKPDKGRKWRLFEAHVRDSLDVERKDEVLNDFVGVEQHSLCSPSLTEVTVKTYEEYKCLTSSAISFATEADDTTPVGATQFNFKHKTGYGNLNNPNEIFLKEFFTQPQREAKFIKAECVTHTVGILPFHEPVFTPAFKSALHILQLTAMDKNPETRKEVFSQFVRSYGTHFARTTHFGYTAYFGKLFATQAKTPSEEVARRRCMMEAARETLTPEARRGCETTGQHFSRLVAAKCGEKEVDVLVTETGSASVSGVADCDLAAKESPRPVAYSLEKISALFREAWIDSRALELKQIRLNGTDLSQLFEEQLGEYSQDVIEKAETSSRNLCSWRRSTTPIMSGVTTDPSMTGNMSGVTTDPSMTGNRSGVTTDPSMTGNMSGVTTDPSMTGNMSGVTTDPSMTGNMSSVTTDPSMTGNISGVTTDPSITSNSTAAVTGPPVAEGNCSSAVNSGIIIVGGSKDTSTPQTPNSLALFTPAPALFPVGVRANTLSRVGDTVLYSCGGYESSCRKKCWVIDTGTDDAWESFDIPWEMWYHSAVVVQEEIWFFLDSKLRILNTRNNTNKFQEFDLTGISFGKHICAVAHGSQTFVVGVGTGQDEVYVNTDYSKPEQWEKFSQLLQGRNHHACLVYGGKILVTGGFAKGSSTAMSSVETISVENGTVRSIAPLSEKRCAHQMAIIDGRPAVLGGWNGTGMATIETYDEQNNSCVTLAYSLSKPRYYFGLTQYLP